MIIETFKQMQLRLEELESELSQGEALKDISRWQDIVKEMKELEEPVSLYLKYADIEKKLGELEELLLDSDMKELAGIEKEELSLKKEELELEMKKFLLPKDPNDTRNVIMEIRPAAGGDEAALFSGLLFRMYSRYAERSGYKLEIIDVSETELKGIKEAVFMIKGHGAFSRMKFEAGVHRVQRVPTTETQGRIHTSTATVAVLPEMDDIDAGIAQSDIRIDVYRASGHGGQYVNTTDSAVRITHIPTGIVVTCQNEKSQLKNKEKAMKVLQSRLYNHLKQQRDSAYADNRKSQLGTGDRSERIRTYNFPQGRVTDHRINLTLYKIDSVMDGELDEIIDGLTVAWRAEQQAE